jgi:hypothetical protein
MLDDNDKEESVEEENKPNRRERRAKDRKPQRSSKIQSNDLKEVYDPKEQYSNPGEPPGRSRFDQVYESGALEGYLGANVFREEISKLQDEQNAFVAWQAKQDEYTIFQNVDFDEEKGQDVWAPINYKYYPLTIGQRLGLQKLEAEVNDLQRAIQNNDKTTRNANERLYEKTVNLLQEQCARYLRMDVEKEFEASNYADVTLALASARYAELHVPKSQRMRMSSDFSKGRKSTGVA